VEVALGGGCAITWVTVMAGSGCANTGTELLQLALSNSESVLHRWPRTLSLSALRKDVGSNGRCSRQNSL